MGYRNYIASLPKDEYENIKDFTEEELQEYKSEPMDDYPSVGVYDLAPKKLIELGKYVDRFPEELQNPFFTNKKLQEDYTIDHDLYVVGKEFLEVVIEHYTEKVRTYYDDMLKNVMTDEKYPRIKDPDECESTDLYKIVEHVRNMSYEWGYAHMDGNKPYNLELGDSVTTSWKYEYEIFEMVRVYKSFDWENNVMVYYGY